MWPGRRVGRAKMICKRERGEGRWESSASPIKELNDVKFCVVVCGDVVGEIVVIFPFPLMKVLVTKWCAFKLCMVSLEIR